MRITIIAAGKLKETYLTTGVAEFMKRLAPFARVEIRETSEEPVPKNPSPAEREQALCREGKRLLDLVPEGSYLFVLDVRGKERSSEEFAQHMETLALTGQSNIAFLIGGPFGISREVRAAADDRLSFSKFTFTHQMVRLLLVEQIYRAFKIWRGEKYHW